MKYFSARSLELLTAAVLALASLSVAQVTQASAPPESAGLARFMTAPPNLIHRLDERGLLFQGAFAYDWSNAVPGDRDSGMGFGRYSFDLSLALDGRKAMGWEGSAGLVRFKHHLNTFGDTFDGAAQLYSNMDAPSRTTLYELWLEQRLFSNKLRFKGGKIDANSEFAAVHNAGDFLNSSMGFSPTIMAFPSYPEPRLGFNLFLHPSSNYGVGLGIFQTSMGALSIVEPEGDWNAGGGDRPGRMSFGYWRLNGSVIRLDGAPVSAAQGFYSVVEQSGWPHPWQGKDGERRLSTFLQFGSAENQVSAFTQHLGGGLVIEQVFHKRSHDSAGFAATWVRFSSAPTASFELRAEMAWEGYYKATLTRHLAMVQDFQFLHHPGGRKEQTDCSVITPRLVVSF